MRNESSTKYDRTFSLRSGRRIFVDKLKRGETKEIAKRMCKNGRQKTAGADIDIGY